MKLLKKYFIITLGCLIYALGFALFLGPSDLAAGGVSGISVIITHFFRQIDKGILILVLNLPLLLIGTIVFGGKFFFGTVYATVFSSLFITFFEMFLTPPTVDYVCSALAGALLTGIGMGMIFREEATTGGTDIVVRLIQKRKPHLRTGNIFLIVDSIIVFAAGIVFKNFNVMIYSAASLWANTYIFNLVLYGGTRAKLVIIISDDKSILTEKLKKETGITVLKGHGAYSGDEKEVLLCAVDKRKYPKVTKIISEISPGSLIITAPAEGFEYGRSLY